MCVLNCFSRVRLFVTHTDLWTLALQAALSMGFSKQEYWSGLPFPYPGDLRDPGIQPGSPRSKYKFSHLSGGEGGGEIYIGKGNFH